MLDTKSTNNNSNIFNLKKLHIGMSRWILLFILIPILVTAIFMCAYPGVEQEATERCQNPLESEEFIQLLYQNNYVLYKELYEKVNGTKEDYQNLFMDISVVDGYENMMRLEEYLMEVGKLPYRDNDLPETLERNPEDIKKIYLDYIDESGFYTSIAERFDNFEYNMNVTSRFLDYKIIDNETIPKLISVICLTPLAFFGNKFI